MEKQRQRGVTDFLRILESDKSIFSDMETDLWVKLDTHGEICWVNRSFEKRLDRKLIEMIGRPLIVIVYADDIVKFIKAFYNPKKSEPFRLLHKGYGVVTVKLIDGQFIKMSEGKPTKEKYGYIIMRPIRE